MRWLINTVLNMPAKETEDKYDEVDLQRTLFYSIKRNGKFIGYLGFHGEDTALEPEIYIFKQYRNKGYGTRVLKRFVNMAFTDGLMRVSRDKAEKKPGRLIIEQLFGGKRRTKHQDIIHLRK